MEAHIYRLRGEWFVSLRLLGVEVDEAGPFDDEHDAVEMARRSGADIVPHNPISREPFNVLGGQRPLKEMTSSAHHELIDSPPYNVRNESQREWRRRHREAA